MVAASGFCLHPLKDLFLHLLEVIAGLRFHSVTEWCTNSASSFSELEAFKNAKREKQKNGVCINLSVLVGECVCALGN